MKKYEQNKQDNNEKSEDNFSFLELYAECIAESYNELGDFAKKELGPEGRQMWKWDKKYRKASACMWWKVLSSIFCTWCVAVMIARFCLKMTLPVQCFWLTEAVYVLVAGTLPYCLRIPKNEDKALVMELNFVVLTVAMLLAECALL